MAAQADGLLVGDRQPGVLASTYQVIGPPPGTAPGRYTLELRVDAGGERAQLPRRRVPGSAPLLPLAAVTVAPPQQPGAPLSPHFPLDPALTPWIFRSPAMTCRRASLRRAMRCR